MKPVNVFWFRRDLRSIDNHGLYRALNSGLPVLPIFIFDTDILKHLDKHDRRVDFIHQALEMVHHELEKHGSGIKVFHGKPEDAFRELLNNYSVREVFTNHDYEPYAIKRDEKIHKLLGSHNIPFLTFKDQVIFEKDEVVKDNGDPFKVFTPYSKKWRQRFNITELKSYPSEKLSVNFLKHKVELPSLKDLGFKKTEIQFNPFDLKDAAISTYDEYRDLPSEQTTRIGIHLRFGTISIREVFRHAGEGTWQKELIWREFFMAILWRFPHVEREAFNKKFASIKWRNNEDEFEKWQTGMTGYPLVDAGMRELNETGFMHNRVRMITASFLCKHLLIDWRWGEAYFAEKLDDYELSSNNGNWQWVAGTGVDASPYFRIFNPDEQLKKFDKEQKYVSRWVPELNTPDYPEKMVDHKTARERALATYRKAIGLL